MIFTFPVCSDLIHAKHNDREMGRPFSGFKTLPQPPLHKSIGTSVQGGQEALVKIKLCYPAPVLLSITCSHYQRLRVIIPLCWQHVFPRLYQRHSSPHPHYQTVCMLSCACHRVVFPPYTGVIISCTCYLFYVLSQSPNAYNSLRR